MVSGGCFAPGSKCSDTGMLVMLVLPEQVIRRMLVMLVLRR